MFNLPTNKRSIGNKKPSELIKEFANPWLQQTQVLEAYENDSLQAPNVAIEMPTGTGKTLVGLTIAHYKQNAERLKIVYLCPNKQLARQVHEEAKKNNINTCLITNSKTSKENYTSADIDKYNQAKSIAITTYSGLFNINPKTQNPDIVICDDINAAEDAINNMWAIEIDKNIQPELFAEIKSNFNNFNIQYYSNEDRVDLVELSSWYANKENILSLLQNSNQDNIKYSLQNLGNNLEICNIFISFDKILIKPFLPPTFKNLHYYNAKQRIFLSATMGVSGEIERLTGQNNIKYIRCDETAINGLRFFILPHQLDDPKNFFLEYIKNSKTLLIVNSNKIRDIFIKFFEKELPELSVLTNDDLEKLLPKFDEELIIYAYEKIWSELSELDRKIVYVISTGVYKTWEIREKLSISPQLLNTYRKRLMERGVVNGSVRGKLTLALPRFEEYIEMYCEVNL